MPPSTDGKIITSSADVRSAAVCAVSMRMVKKSLISIIYEVSRQAGAIFSPSIRRARPKEVTPRVSRIGSSGRFGKLDERDFGLIRLIVLCD